jgi:uncharacterized protein
MSNDISSRSPSESTQTTGASWGVTRALLGIVTSFFGAQVLIWLFFGAFVSFEGWSDQQANDWALNSVVGQFVLLFLTSLLSLTVLYPFTLGSSRQQLLDGLGLNRPKLKVVGYALVAAVVYFGIYIVAASLADQFTHVNVEQEQDIGFKAAHSATSLILTFISLAIIPPIVEEIMFRGFLYGGLRKQCTVLWSAIITSVIFAAPHATQSTDGGILWIAAIDTFILSMVLTNLREKTGSIYGGMIVHAIKNSVAFLFVFILHK